MRSLGALVVLTSISALALGCGDDGTSAADTADTDHDHDHGHESGAASSTGAGDTASPGSTGDPDTTVGGPSTGSDDATAGVDSTGSTGDTTGSAADAVSLQFALRVGTQDAACGEVYPNVGAMDTTIELRDARLFVSSVALVDGEGNETEVALDQDGLWQYDTVALLDFEDGTAACTEQTTAETNTTVRGTVPTGDYVGIHFTVGLPFELNHLDVDAATTEPPLNSPGMFWAWAAGHKFMRIDINTDEAAPDNAWNFHLGAQGCTANSPMEPPDAPCTRPALVDVMLPTGFDPATGTVVIDLAALYDGVDVTADTPMTATGCMSFMPDVNECDDLFPNLGLDWATGDCDNGCAGQTVFSVE